MSIIQAILISLVYFLGNGTLIGVGYFTLYRPLVAGFLTGLILGDPVLGTTIGATINLMYIGHISAGGSLPGDPALAGIVGASLGITAGLDVGATIAIATPLGLLGTLLWFGRLTLSTMFVPLADKLAKEGKASKWWIVNVGLPQALLFLLTFIPCFIIVYFGANHIQGVLNFLGEKVLGVLIIIGGMLPALGLALTLKYIYQKDARVYFFLGFLLVVFFGLNMVSVGLMALILAIVYMQNKNYVDDKVGKGAVFEKIEDEEATSANLPRNVLVRSWINWTFHAQGTYNYERMMGIGFAHSMVPAFRHWYKEESEEMKEALTRHTGFYNTSPQFASIINGLTLAMEEKIYQKTGNIDGEMINAVKTSLMGPLAGIGDTVVQGVIVPLLLSFFIGMSIEGNIAGPILYTLVVVAVIYGISWALFSIGYRQGNAAIVNILESGYINKIIDAARVMGCIVIGALVANYVSVQTGITFNFGGETPFVLQKELFDAILPKMLPLLLTLGCYKLLNKGVSSTKVMLLIIVVGVVGGLTGILG